MQSLSCSLWLVWCGSPAACLCVFPLGPSSAALKGSHECLFTVACHEKGSKNTRGTSCKQHMWLRHTADIQEHKHTCHCHPSWVTNPPTQPRVGAISDPPQDGSGTQWLCAVALCSSLQRHRQTARPWAQQWQMMCSGLCCSSLFHVIAKGCKSVWCQNKQDVTSVWEVITVGKDLFSRRKLAVAHVHYFSRESLKYLLSKRIDDFSGYSFFCFSTFCGHDYS